MSNVSSGNLTAASISLNSWNVIPEAKRTKNEQERNTRANEVDTYHVKVPEMEIWIIDSNLEIKKIIRLLWIFKRSSIIYAIRL